MEAMRKRLEILVLLAWPRDCTSTNPVLIAKDLQRKLKDSLTTYVVVDYVDDVLSLFEKLQFSSWKPFVVVSEVFLKHKRRSNASDTSFEPQSMAEVKRLQTYVILTQADDQGRLENGFADTCAIPERIFFRNPSTVIPLVRNFAAGLEDLAVQQVERRRSSPRQFANASSEQMSELQTELLQNYGCSRILGQPYGGLLQVCPLLPVLPLFTIGPQPTNSSAARYRKILPRGLQTERSKADFQTEGVSRGQHEVRGESSRD
mmetsp:Transcript_10665/g.40135  ORF Transcript_10665/g.40135 Transcript_10665/m.40135 type:complete len:261 (-) Transcript_10665:161-943(-)|eukprot:scaffold3491_cov153-Pinguiococcus_pyrenoidosus.AAC.2